MVLDRSMGGRTQKINKGLRLIDELIGYGNCEEMKRLEEDEV